MSLLKNVPWDKVAKVGFVLVSTFAGVSAVNSHMEVGKMKAEKSSATKLEITHKCVVSGELVLPKK